MSRTNRKNKTGGKSVSSRCRNNGDCEYCNGNRTHKNNKRDNRDKAYLEEILGGSFDYDKGVDGIDLNYVVEDRLEKWCEASKEMNKKK